VNVEAGQSSIADFGLRISDWGFQIGGNPFLSPHPQPSLLFKAARNALRGMDTEPIIFIRFLPEIERQDFT
jgi:hypothetical protein